MAEMVILGALAAFGGLCALWLLAAMWLPGDRDGIMLHCWRGGAGDRGFMLRWRLLWDLGLVRGKLAVVDLGMTDEDKAFLARWGRNVQIWETEDGTGTGDHSGRHRRRGISEL